MNCGRICVRDVDVAEPGESIQAVAQRMQARNVGTLVVIDRLSRPIGLMTDRDLVTRVLAQSRDSSQMTVEEVMSKPVHTVCEDTSIEDGLRIMRSGPFRRVPVIDSLGNFVGILSLDDVLALLTKEFTEIGRLLAEESPTRLARQ